MVLRKELVVGIEELRYVSIECPQCRTRVVLDMQERSAMAEKYDWFAPAKCPGCQVDYDSGLRDALNRLQKLYRPLRDFAGSLSFRAEAREETGR